MGATKGEGNKAGRFANFHSLWSRGKSRCPGSTTSSTIHTCAYRNVYRKYVCCFLRWPFQVRFQLQVLEQLCCCYCCCSLHICEVTFNFDDGWGSFSAKLSHTHREELSLSFFLDHFLLHIGHIYHFNCWICVRAAVAVAAAAFNQTIQYALAHSLTYYVEYSFTVTHAAPCRRVGP